MSEATEKITYAVDRLGDRICASLDEVRWQLVQQGRTLDRILRALTESRNNEAQQLVRQGVRLCATEEYEEAEQVFREALTKDKTDYQVLMNLAFIEIHKGNAQAAFEFFRQALQRPDPSRLNDAAKARTLWATARLHYAEGQYAEALKTADRAMTLERNPKAGALFTTAVYAALAGDRDVCLTRIRAAIETDSALFAKVAAAPNLGRMRADVLRLLSEMAASVLADARRAVDDNRRLLAQVAEGAHAASYQHLLGMAREKIDEAEKLVQVASYASCRDLVIPLTLLKEIIGQIARLEQLYDEAALAEAAVAECEPRLSEAARQLQARRSELDTLRWENARKPWFSRILSDVLRLLGSPDELAAARANVQNAERSFIFHKARLAESRGPATTLDEKTASLTTMIAQQLSQFTLDRPARTDGSEDIAGADANVLHDDVLYDVVLRRLGHRKLELVKVAKAVTGLSLMDAKHMVESLPAIIKRGVLRGEAQNAKEQLEAAGGVVELVKAEESLPPDDALMSLGAGGAKGGRGGQNQSNRGGREKDKRLGNMPGDEPFGR